MKFKFIFLLFFLVNFAFAQSEQDLIRKDFETIVNYTRQGQMEKILDMTYPKIFEKMPKETMLGMMKMATEGMGMKMIYEQNTINLNMSSIEKLKDATICLSSYDQTTVIEFTSPMMAKMFLMAKNEDYTVDKIDDKKIKMSGKAYLLAIKDTYTKNTWKYLNYDQTMDPSSLSSEIYKKSVELKTALKAKK